MVVVRRDPTGLPAQVIYRAAAGRHPCGTATLSLYWAAAPKCKLADRPFHMKFDVGHFREQIDVVC